MNRTFIYPSLGGVDLGIGRLFGPGLGNLLLPWARAVLASHRLGLPFIEPTWPQLKVGPILRRERDKRFYTNLFKARAHDVHGVRKLILLAAAIRHDEADLTARRGRSLRPRLLVFRGLGTYFEPLLGHDAILASELVGIARPEHLAGWYADFTRTIAVHVRLGDFLAPDASALQAGRHGFRTRVRWYVRIVEQLRGALGEDLAVRVFSDGHDEQLADLLALPHTARATFGSSLADLLALSRAPVLVGSTGSTFSMWASFLGRMPVLWHAGRLAGQRLYPDAPELELEADGQRPLPDPFLAACRARYAS